MAGKRHTREEQQRGELPKGWQWAEFVGGSKNRAIEPMRGPLEPGHTYEKLVTNEIWVWDGQRFVLEGAPTGDLAGPARPDPRPTSKKKER